MFSLSINAKQMERRLSKLALDSPKEFEKALEKASLQFLTWCNNGSTKETRKPPIAKGFLRGSSSAFVGNKLVGVFQGQDNSMANKSHSAPTGQATFGWNAEYATKMHETEYALGSVSEQDGDAGNKWLEKHLQADKEDFMALITKFVKEGLKT